jgi:hypothetical protein
MNVIPFPDPGRVFSHADRDSIYRFAEQFPNCDLEFGKQNGHDVAMLCINNVELCILCQKKEVVIAGMRFDSRLSADVDTKVIAKASTINEALHKLYKWSKIEV